MNKTVAGINGFGRVGLHLLRYWLDRHEEAGYSIGFINDDTLDLDQAYEIINTDRYVTFEGYRIERADGALVISGRDGVNHEILYTHAHQAGIQWLGQPDIFFECTGKYTQAPTCQPYLRDNTRLVIISATSWDADKTLVYGFNHAEFDRAKHPVVSYGSCTVNAYVPFAHFVHERFGVVDSDVNVVHNIPEYRLAGHQTLLRKFCTLERSGPQLLPFISEEDNFVVNYSVVPWTGVSMIDFRFRLERPVGRDKLIADLLAATREGELEGLYWIDKADVGPQALICTPYSMVFIEQGIKVRRDNIYLQGYFDTENSVNRFHDLADYLARKI